MRPSEEEAGDDDATPGKRDPDLYPWDNDRWSKILEEYSDSDDDHEGHLSGDPVELPDLGLPSDVPLPKEVYVPPGEHELRLLSAARIERSDESCEPTWADAKGLRVAIETFCKDWSPHRAVELVLGQARGLDMSLPYDLTTTLLRLGASPDSRIVGTRTWLHEAVDTPWPDLDSVLALIGAKPTPTLRDSDGATAFHRLFSRLFSANYFDDVRQRCDFATTCFAAFLDAGFDIDASWSGQSPRDLLFSSPSEAESSSDDVKDDPLTIFRSTLESMRRLVGDK